MADARHARFVVEYAVRLNGTKAAIAAGFSKNGAAVQANKLLKRPEIRAAIQKIIDARAAKAGVKLERVLEELALIAFVDPREFYDLDGDLIPVHALPENVARALAGFEVEELVTKRSIVKKIRYEKLGALRALLEHLSPSRGVEVKLPGKNGEAVTFTLKLGDKA